MPGADVRQGLGAVQPAGAGRQVETGVLVAQRDRGAQLHAAHLVHRAHEAGEADLQVVVDADAGHVLDGAHHERRTAVRERRVELVGVRRVVGAGDGEGVLGEFGVGVAGQADDGRPVARRGQVEQQDGVGAVARGVAEVVALAFLGGEALARVGADQQDGETFSALGPVGQAGERIDSLDAVLGRVDHHVAHPAGRQDQSGDDGRGAQALAAAGCSGHVGHLPTVTVWP
nr:hypothetical protein [Streptomyces specialis]